MGGFGFNVGPLGLGISPIGTIGLGLNFGVNTGNQGLNAMGNTIGNLGLGQAMRSLGVPTSFNPLSLIGALAPALGPAGLGLGAFNSAVALANAIAQMSGVMTTQQALQAVTAAPQGNQLDATMTQNALSDATTAALSGQHIAQNNPFGLAALSALGLQGAQLTSPQGVAGYVATNAAGVPIGQLAAPSPFGISSVSGTKGATMVADTNTARGVGDDPTGPVGLTAADVDTATTAEQGEAGVAAGPTGDAPSGVGDTGESTGDAGPGAAGSAAGGDPGAAGEGGPSGDASGDGGGG